MAKKKMSMPRLEVILIIVFFVSFVLWAMRKCSENKDLYPDEVPPETEETITATDSIITPEIFNVPPTPPKPTGPNVNVRSGDEPPSNITREKFTPLYVTIENLNMREIPALNGKILDRLKLYDEVIFLNEVTDSIYQIDLGNLPTEAPWVKVKNKKGIVGWVYGAGVHYYKKKLEGVE